MSKNYNSKSHVTRGDQNEDVKTKDNGAKYYGGSGKRYSHHSGNVRSGGKASRTTVPTNDPEWYTNRNNTGLAGTYSWFHAVGLGEDIGNSQVIQRDLDVGLRPTVDKSYLPGICRFSLAHTIGASGMITGAGGVSPINVGLNKLYSNIRHANSGARNYEKSDLGIYLLAVADAYSYYGMMVRAYTTMRKFSTQNRYYAKCLVEALGFEYDTLVTNLPGFKTYINQYALRLNVLYIPNNWSYFKRRFMLYSNVFVDEPSEKAQLYVFVPKYFLQFHRDANDGHGQLVAKYFSYSTKINLATIQSLGNSLINDIILDDDFNLMSGDIAKWTSDTFTLPFIPDDTIINFTYDPLVLAQIENLTVEGIPIDGTTDGDVVVDQTYDSNNDDYLINNVVINGPTVSSDQQFAKEIIWAKMKRILNIHKPNLTEGELLDATRLCNKPSHIDVKLGTRSLAKYYDYCSTEVVCDYTVFRNAMGDSVTSTYGYVPNNVTFNEAGATAGIVELLQFNQHPMFPIVESAQDGSSGHIQGYTGNVDNHIYLDVSDMKRVHEASLLSLFDVN